MPEPDETPETSSETELSLGDHTSDVVLGVARRLRFRALERHHDSVVVKGLFVLINNAVSIALMAGAAELTREPFLFPSLGPTAFLLFYTPYAPSASPRNSVCGHLIAVLAGYGALAVTGLLAAGPAGTGVTTPRVIAAALSLGVTCGAMIWFRVPHPPAGATTLIVSLGIITHPVHLAVLMLAVVLLVVQGLAINRFAGIAYPLWSASPRTGTRGGGGRHPDE